MCICSNFSRRGENSPSPHISGFVPISSPEAASKPALKPAARLILKDCLFCSKFAWSRTGIYGVCDTEPIEGERLVR